MYQLLNRFRHHIAIICINIFVTGFFLADIVNWIELEYVDELENLLYDTRVILTMPNETDPTIVIVDIDEKSLNEVGRWPWSRDKLASLVNELYNYYGVAMIGFDIFFREPDESSGIKILEQLGRNEFSEIEEYQKRLEELRPILDYDQLFIDSISKGLSILGYNFFSADGIAGNITDGVLPDPVLYSADPQILNQHADLNFQ